MSKHCKYSILLITRDGRSTPIIESEPSTERVRSIARSIKIKPGRKIIILRDGKELPGGVSALDDIAYQAWLESHRPDDRESQK